MMSHGTNESYPTLERFLELYINQSVKVIPKFDQDRTVVPALQVFCVAEGTRVWAIHIFIC